MPVQRTNDLIPPNNPFSQRSLPMRTAIAHRENTAGPGTENSDLQAIDNKTSALPHGDLLGEAKFDSQLR